jgi:hypothetical protein
MDQDFSDITIKDTIDRKRPFKTFFDVIFYILIIFAIFSIIITIININKISNNKNGYLVHKTNTVSTQNYTLTTYNYLCYKIVKINNNSSSDLYFRFWFMDNVDY